MAPMVYAMEVPSYDHMRFNSSSIFCKFWNGALRLSTLAIILPRGAADPDTLITYLMIELGIDVQQTFIYFRHCFWLIPGGSGEHCR